MTGSEAANPLDRYLQGMIDASASDLFLRADEPPVLRVSGQLVRSELPTPNEATMRGFRDALLTGVAAERFERSPDVDVAYTLTGGERFRVNLFMHQGRMGLVVRHVPPATMGFESLNLPGQLREMAEKRRGLILVVGPTGCGKSTTLAAMLHHINATRADHIVTVEDPIEFVHRPDRSLIHQRQVGYDTESFATALRHVVRQSPDVILIGEMRDRDTMDTAVHAALTGHLVLSTLHTTSAVQSLDRMLSDFPADARPQVRSDLSQTLIGIASMRLLPRADGAGRVPAIELLLGTPTVRRLLTEGRFDELHDAMKRGHESGMITLNQSLVDLCNRGLVDQRDALPHSPNPEEFRLNLSGMYTGIESIDMRARDELAAGTHRAPGQQEDENEAPEDLRG
jgi:twitching motility protein PilT